MLSRWRVGALLLGVFIVGYGSRGVAADSVPASVSSFAPESEPAYDTAIVKVDGRSLFRVRGTIDYPAEKRAKKIQARIEAFASDPSASASDISIVVLDDRSKIVANDYFFGFIFDADASAIQIPRALLAERAREAIIDSIARYRSERDPSVLLRHTLMASVATLVVALLFLLLRRVFHRIRIRAEQTLKTRMETIEKRSARVIESRAMWSVVEGGLRTLYVVAVCVVSYMYLNLVLGLYPWTRPLATQLLSVLLQPLKLVGNGFVRAIPDLIFLTVLFFLMSYLLKIVRVFFDGIGRGSIQFDNFPQEWALPTYRIVRTLLIAFAAVVAYPYIPGSSSEAFKGISLFIGVIFSLGSTSFISNIIAGTAMTYRRAFRVGDRVEINGVLGTVSDIRVQSTHIRTVKNEEVILPNSLILNSHVKNYSTLAKADGLILHTTVGIGYETPWRQVEAMLLLAASRTTDIKTEPRPFVLQKGLGDFCVTYELNVYCDNPAAILRIYTALHQNILDVFNEYGVQIMTPAYEGDPQTPKIVPKDQWHAAPAAHSK